MAVTFAFGCAFGAFAHAARTSGFAGGALDNRVKFRFCAPNAKELRCRWRARRKNLAMQKDEQGVWSVTTEGARA